MFSTIATMQPMADFWGELAGSNWNVQAVAISLGALAALITAVVALAQGRASRQQERELKAREHWWDRFKSTLDDLTSLDETKKSMALPLLEKLSDVKWASDDDRRLVVTVLAKATEIARKEASQR